MALEIEAADVIKIILQFCKENSLTESFAAIQAQLGCLVVALGGRVRQRRRRRRRRR